MVPSLRAPGRVGDLLSWLSCRHVAARPDVVPVRTIAVAPAVAALLVGATDAWAEHECGPPVAGVEIVCSPSNYDPDRDGNIFYGPDDTNEDIAIRLSEGLSIRYRREAPGDDVYVPPDDPGNPRYSAVWVTLWEAGSGKAGAIALTSFADVTSNGRGISVGHYGEAGPLRMEILGGSITTTGEGSYAIHNYREGTGSTDFSVRSVSARTDGTSAIAIVSSHWGEGTLNIDVRDTTLATNGRNADGVYGAHHGEGDLAIGLRDVTIAASGFLAYGIYSLHTGVGPFRIDAQELAIHTTGVAGRGVYGLHSGAGDVDIQLRGGTVSTMGPRADGIVGIRRNQGELTMRVQDVAVATAGDEAQGVRAEHRGDGAVRADIQRTNVATEGDQAEGLQAQHQGTGALNAILRHLDLTTAGSFAEGIFAAHAGMGAVDVDARDTTVATTGKGSDAILAGHTGAGDLGIHIRGSALSTRGAEARGMFAAHRGDGALDLDLRLTAIATTGEHADGVAAEHEGSGSIRIAVDESSVRATGAHANGIRIGRLNQAGTPEGAAAADENGNRDQSVTVNGPVLGGSGDGAGVFLAGGGSVTIGPRGSLGAASGVAIRAAGDAPRLRVDLQLDDRRVAEVIGDHAIRSDGGETTIRVNDVVLHEGGAGATGLAVPNGPWNVTLVETGTVAGRAFSLGDFREVYAPRAAVYEALPGFLLRLDAPGLSPVRSAAPGSPAWIRLSGARESHVPDRASAGAEYAFDRFAAEAGLDLPVSEDAAIFVAARRLRGAAAVMSPTGGGEIETRGSGVALGVAVREPNAYYARGRFALMNYTSDLSSNPAGALASGIDARVDTLDLEAGRRMALNENLQLTPRVWIARSAMEVDAFTDPTGSHVVVRDVTRVTGGAGVLAGMAQARSWEGAELSLQGSLDIARTLSGTTTSVSVSGETLESQPPGTRLLLGLGGMLRRDRLSVEARIRVGGLVSGDAEYAGQVGLGWSF